MAFVGRSDVKDPGAQQDQWERLARRRERLYADDMQFCATRPDERIAAAARAPRLRIGEVMATVLRGYADRPALGQRVREVITDPATGRSTLKYLPRFETVSYADLWARVQALAGDWHHHERYPVRTGDFVCVLGFASIDYTAIECACIHLGAVVVPLQTNAPAAQHAPILVETQPRIFAVGIDNLEIAVEAALAGTAPQRLVVFDYESRDDDQRASYLSARARLEAAGSALVIETLDDVVAQGMSHPAPPLHVAPGDEDPLAWVFYTSGSTGTPKGAMFTESLCIGTWLAQSDQPVITLSYMPMSHLIGYGYVILTLANGGTSYFAAKSDLSTLFEDLALVRPTSMSLVPRVCEMFYHHYQRELDRRAPGGGGSPDAAEELTTAIREQILGGRVLAVGCGSAALSPEIKDFMETVLDQHLLIGYSSTEIAGGMIVADEHVLRPPVIDYKLLDVPELGYFNTDKPYPRGELAVKSARFMAGYYNRPDLTATMFDEDGYYKTGDIMAEVGTDRLRYVDRRNNVIKLAQGEFVAVSRLEALYSTSPLIHQIYVYGNSERSFLLAVIVPTEGGVGTSTIAESLRHIARDNALNGYEIPRDFLIETDPFSLANGLLSGVGKFLRPKLKARYGERLEQLYAEMADDQLQQLRSLRTGGADQPVLATVSKAVQATLGVPAADVSPEARFIDLGGDSLSALTFSTLLADIYGVEVPVGVVIDPTGDLLRIADHIERHRNSDSLRPSYASVHDTASHEVLAGDLRLDKFIDDDILKTAMSLPAPTCEIRTVLLTGSTGFLGRFLGLEWLQRLADSGGTLVCLTRGADAAHARGRIEAALDSDPKLLDRFRTLAEDHLEVVAGDIGEPNFGLEDATWQRLTETVDLIVHPAAHVNHVLPYQQLFGPNVVGTAEVIRLAITAKLKPIHYISTMGVSAVAHQLVDEDTDIRRSVPACVVGDSYANGYGISKWAGEVLMREAHDLCGLPVAVFRPGMILADSRYAGQLNAPDIFTRLLFSLVATGVAPRSFYHAGGASPHYEGLPVDFLAEAVAAIGPRHGSTFDTYNTTNPHDDGISMDTFVDWIIAAGYPVEKIDDYPSWLARFETSMRALPERERAQSVLTVLDVYREPMLAIAGSPVPGAQFQSAVEHSGRAIPHVSQQLIEKYLADLQRIGVLSR
ncbi:carboxylic acid reductase [Mycobacterium montefiorense]|uniref:Carboxylic acid reductase n=1 Tax=Mycobacterium montefiorense TaxID=154654 RepID=A0AA37PJQ2_9MYCO|nr:carboxylic acid reductase [Mycobacterium montefiorense]GBG38808.1 putative fatty-acid-CoA ligase FadD [Mycobacterium montefiorense]GKU34636.1 putative fatty-acid-CoA ligase FadD [Mycobacterium montefiorense]GKU38117.1 putative fatty-acid-CoA ligase FadD [Mycobacterium montefiorense]GKU43405.1 putative fatty-acid-CoA ligase FadD [Mycobacterium montefiorense]GKU50021.1 putative fatty-acid-CoA ligase FadD [Mycobacterium montefiorense]